MHKTYKKRQLLRKPHKKISKKRHQRGGNTKTIVDDAAPIYDASKIHPASLHLDKKFLIKPSSVHGLGVFANKNIEKNEIIHRSIHMLKHPSSSQHLFKITPEFGVYLNHSSLKDNTELIKLNDGDYYIIATKFIPYNTEILINYDGKNLPPFIDGSKLHYKP